MATNRFMCAPDTLSDSTEFAEGNKPHPQYPAGRLQERAASTGCEQREPGRVDSRRTSPTGTNYASPGSYAGILTRRFLLLSNVPAYLSPAAM